MRKMNRVMALLIIMGLIQACGVATPAPSAQPGAGAPLPTGGPNDFALAQSKIKHIIIIMQENRSFDEYFGTYPGADGIPMQNGVPTVCLPDRELKQCDK